MCFYLYVFLPLLIFWPMTTQVPVCITGDPEKVFSQVAQTAHHCSFTVVQSCSAYSQIRAELAIQTSFHQGIPVRLMDVFASANERKHEGIDWRKYLRYCEAFISFVDCDEKECLSKATGLGNPTKDIYILASSNKNNFQRRVPHLKPKQFNFLQFPKTTEGPETLPATASSVKLNGLFLTVVGVHIPPLMIMKDGKPVSGVMYKLFRQASRHFNFTYSLTAGMEGTGRVLPNGTWTGMVGDLMYRRFDISATIRVTPQRYGLIDEADYLTQDPPIFITSLPKLYVRSGAILYPFTFHMWGMIILAFAFIVVVLLTLITMKQHHDLPSAWSNVRKYVWKAFIIPFSLTFDQGTWIPHGTRLVTATWMLFMIVISAAYKEKLFSFLTFPQPESVPRSVEELHRMTGYKIVFHYWKSALYNLFVTSEHQMHRDLVKRFVLEPDITKCVLLAVFEPKTVCIAFQSLAQLTLASNATLQYGFQTAVYSSNILLMDPMYIGIALQKDSPYTRDISRVSSMFRDGGFIGYWQEQEFRKYELKGMTWMKENKGSYAHMKLEQILSENLSTTKPLKLGQFAVIFLSIGIAFLGGILAFIYEKRIHMSCFPCNYFRSIENGRLDLSNCASEDTGNTNGFEQLFSGNSPTVT